MLEQRANWLKWDANLVRLQTLPCPGKGLVVDFVADSQVHNMVTITKIGQSKYKFA